MEEKYMYGYRQIPKIYPLSLLKAKCGPMHIACCLVSVQRYMCITDLSKDMRETITIPVSGKVGGKQKGDTVFSAHFRFFFLALCHFHLNF